jgi:hypothetical protein
VIPTGVMINANPIGSKEIPNGENATYIKPSPH